MGWAMQKPKDEQARPLNEMAVRQIGKKLRESFDEVVNEPVPDRFAALLDELEKSEGEQDKDR
ncbi:MAG: NepR family anti-sigma factor [Phyllobacteriaceae bacterium]|jgi:hemerythrin-like domain-containing protein|nr:NepR family anti-sigma factor [Phyllobacteriaceae bacterium]